MICMIILKESKSEVQSHTELELYFIGEIAGFHTETVCAVVSQFVADANRVGEVIADFGFDYGVSVFPL